MHDYALQNLVCKPFTLPDQSHSRTAVLKKLRIYSADLTQLLIQVVTDTISLSCSIFQLTCVKRISSSLSLSSGFVFWSIITKSKAKSRKTIKI